MSTIEFWFGTKVDQQQGISQVRSNDVLLSAYNVPPKTGIDHFKAFDAILACTA